MTGTDDPLHDDNWRLLEKLMLNIKFIKDKKTLIANCIYIQTCLTV